jgi:phosphatidylglycerophosphatase A
MTDVPVAPPQWMRWVATWFGCGYAKKAPGTVGSLGAIPLFLALGCYNPLFACPYVTAQPSCCGRSCSADWVYWAVVLLLTVLGVLSAGAVAQASNQSDPQHVVIDEVAGTLIALGMVQHRGAVALLLAWLLFRALDIWKPWPISAAERAKPVGLGIMLDDLLAGAAAGAIAVGISTLLPPTP